MIVMSAYLGESGAAEFAWTRLDGYEVHISVHFNRETGSLWLFGQVYHIALLVMSLGKAA